MLHTDRVYSFKSDIVLRVFDDEALLVDLNTQTIFGLNETGGRMAQLISDGVAEGDILRHLAAEYDAEARQLAHDLDQFLQFLHEHDLIVENNQTRTGDDA